MVEITRRNALALSLLPIVTRAYAADLKPTRAWDFTFTSIEDGTLHLADFRGRVLLVVNAASFCGYTYQYEALEKLHADLSPRGLTVIGVPSQDFNQEKASNAEVKDFCEATFGVTFPMAGITHVRGPQRHPFYDWVRALDGWEPQWNFNKVLIARDGSLVAHFGSGDEPTGPALTHAIAQQLALTAS
jgi:glutathione peroxidase